MGDIDARDINYEIEDTNSNAAVDEALRRSGLPLPTQDGPLDNWSPGSDYDLPGGDFAPGGKSFSEELNDWIGDKLLDAITADLEDAFGIANTIGSPIILDLDGDGVETTTVNAGAHFDHAGDGFAEQTGWAGTDDGLLVLDRNANGTIDDGAELFGNNTPLSGGGYAPDGFAALAEEDTDLDGKVDADDAHFADLRVWRDLNQDGISQAGELLTLTDAGVQSIAIAHAQSDLIDANGNAHQQVGSYTTTGGATRTATDVWFQTDPTYSIATEWLAVPADIAALPDITGFGMVRDLHQAMVRDTSGNLQALVTQFGQASAVFERKSLMQSIIYQWAGVESLDPNSRGSMADARQLYAMEAFLVEGFIGIDGSSNPLPGAAGYLAGRYDELADSIYSQLIRQTSLKPLLDSIDLVLAPAGIMLDFNAVQQTLQTRIDSDPVGGISDLIEFNLLYLQTLATGTAWDGWTMLENALRTTPLTPELQALYDTFGVKIEGVEGFTSNGTEKTDILFGGAAANTLSGNGGKDALFGGGGTTLSTAMRVTTCCSVERATTLSTAILVTMCWTVERATTPWTEESRQLPVWAGRWQRCGLRGGWCGPGDLCRWHRGG